LIRQLLILNIFIALTACSNSITDKQTKLNTGVFLENKFEQLTKRALVDSIITFQLDTLTNFTWDTLVVIQPYYPIDILEKMTHVNLKAVGETAIMDDGVNVLAFIKNGQLINYLRLPRDKGDFCSIHRNIVFSKNNCIFEFVRTPNKFSTGQFVVEVNIKN
jgi:hypothetical protein